MHLVLETEEDSNLLARLRLLHDALGNLLFHERCCSEKRFCFFWLVIALKCTKLDHFSRCFNPRQPLMKRKCSMRIEPAFSTRNRMRLRGITVVSR